MAKKSFQPIKYFVIVIVLVFSPLKSDVIRRQARKYKVELTWPVKTQMSSRFFFLQVMVSDVKDLDIQ